MEIKTSAQTAKERLLVAKATEVVEQAFSGKPVEPSPAGSVEATLAQRGSRYGDFTDHARICQNLKYVMYQEKGWEKLSDVQKQAMEVMADKFARILSGDPNYDDNWHDIQGYAKLVEDRLPCNSKKGEC